MLQKQFLTRFIGPLSHICTIRQKDDESLKDFIERFNRESGKVEDADEKVKLVAALGDIQFDSPLWVASRVNPLRTYPEFLDLAYRYIVLETSRREVQRQDVPDKGRRSPSPPYRQYKGKKEEEDFQQRRQAFREKGKPRGAGFQTAVRHVLRV